MSYSPETGFRSNHLSAGDDADRSASQADAPASEQDVHGSHQDAPASHQDRPSSRPEGASSHQEEPSSHQDGPPAHQDRPPSHQDHAPSHQEASPPRIYTFPRMVRYARILTKLGGFEWGLLLRMSKQLGTLLIAQRTLSMPELMAKFDTEPAPHDTPRLSPSRLVYLVTGLVRFTLRDRFCMKRSILIFHYLRKWGYSARVLFGVTKGTDGLQGHAWVELNGLPLAERGDPRVRYAVTYSYPDE